MTSGYDASETLNMKITLTYPAGFDATSELSAGSGMCWIDRELGVPDQPATSLGHPFAPAEQRPATLDRSTTLSPLLPSTAAAVSRFEVWLQDTGSSLKLGPISSSTVGLGRGHQAGPGTNNSLALPKASFRIGVLHPLAPGRGAPSPARAAQAVPACPPATRLTYATACIFLSVQNELELDSITYPKLCGRTWKIRWALAA